MFGLFKRKPAPTPEQPTPEQSEQPKLPNFISTYYDEIDAERSKVNLAIDFDVAKAAGFVAFSVERLQVGTNDEHTIVGFIEEQVTPPKTYEWSLYCSREDHNKIAAQLNATTKVEAPTKKKTK